jgi:hypothetical protein
MPSAGFETVTPAIKRSQTYALDRAATEVGYTQCRESIMFTNVYKQYTQIEIMSEVYFRFLVQVLNMSTI